MDRRNASLRLSVVMDAESKQKRPAFDHDRLATALGTATGKVSSGLHLPFTEPFTSVDISDGGRALTAEFDEGSWKCSLTDYVCSRLPPNDGHQPRGFETFGRLDRTPAATRSEACSRWRIWVLS